ncbi:hypothetical protein D9B85_13170 [Corynebacterium diphtheriae]|nr:hypothetical protein D9B85_13170 [Corynebacterium diphtheriae]
MRCSVWADSRHCARAGTAGRAERPGPAEQHHGADGLLVDVDVLRAKAVDWHAEETADRIDLPESELHAMGLAAHRPRDHRADA